MKPAPVTKLDKKKKIPLKKIDDNIMLENYDVIVIFPIYGQFGAIRKVDSGGIVYEKYIFINSSLLSYEKLKKDSSISNTHGSHNIALSKCTILVKKG